MNVELFGELDRHEKQPGTVKTAGPVQDAIFDVGGVAAEHLAVLDRIKNFHGSCFDSIGGDLVGGNCFYTAFFVFW